MGTLVHKLIQQRYTKPELKRLNGDETDEELSSFDDVERVNDRPLYGKRYRRIKASRNIKESSISGHFDISEDDAGMSSFLARPEYIRMSDVDIGVESGRKAAQSRSIMLNKYDKVLERIQGLIPFTQPDPVTGKPLISPDDMPNFKALIVGMIKSLDMNPQTDIGQNKGVEKTEQDKALEEIDAAEAARVPLDFMPPPTALSDPNRL